MTTLLFLDFTGTIHAWFGWMAKIQFVPAVMAVNAGVVIALVLLTLLVGRVYCSVICPMGVFQDIVGWLGKRSKRNRYTPSAAKTWLRWTVLALFVIAMLAGIVYGLWYYRRPIRLWRVAGCKLTVTFLFNFLLTPLWLHVMYGQAFVLLSSMRIVKNIIKFPVDVVLLMLVLKACEQYQKTRRRV